MHKKFNLNLLMVPIEVMKDDDCVRCLIIHVNSLASLIMFVVCNE